MGENARPNETQQMQVMLRSHVERCLQDVWERPDLVTDGDGDYPYQWGTAACWVSIQPGSEPSVRVFAYAAVGLRRSAKLLAEVNDLNSRSRWARVFWVDGRVMVSAELHWTTLDRASLARTLECVGTVADDIGTLLATVYGGTTWFAPALDAANSDEDAA